MPTQDELLLKLIYQEENKKALENANELLENMTDAEKELYKSSMEAAKAVDKMNAELAKTADAGKKAEGGVKGLGANLNTIATGAFLKIGAAIPGLLADMGQEFLRLGMDMEQTKVAFATLTGSADAANKHLQDLRDFAAGTPFQFTELTEASKRMMAFGFETEKIVPMLRDIGDATSALGLGSEGIDRITRALGQMSAKGKVSAEEMMQLTEGGINGWKYLADATGKTTAEVMKMSEKGLIPANQAIDAILAGMRKDFGGMMAAQSETAAGQLSNLVDSLEEIGTTIGEIMLPMIKDAIKSLKDFFDTIKEGVKVADTLINWQAKINDAYTATEQKIRSTSKSYDEYITNTLLVAGAAGKLTESQTFLIETGTATQTQIDFMTQSVGALTAAQWNATQGAYGYNGALDESNRAAAQAAASTAAASTEVEKLSRIATPTELGMRALAEASRQGGDSTKVWTDFMKEQAQAAKDSAASLQEYHTYVLGNVSAIDSMAASLMKATDQQIKQALVQSQIETLKKAYDEGRISSEELSTATNTLMINAGLATEKSLLLASAQDAVNKAFFAGKIPLDEYIASSDLVKKSTDDGKLSFDELTKLGLGPAGTGIQNVNTYIQDLKNSGIDPATGSVMNFSKQLKELPKKITVEVEYRQTGSPSSSGGSAAGTSSTHGTGRAAGANFIVPPGYPNDTYPMRVTSGERVIVEPRQAVVNNNWNVTADMAGMALLLERQRMMNLTQFEARM